MAAVNLSRVLMDKVVAPAVLIVLAGLGLTGRAILGNAPTQRRFDPNPQGYTHLRCSSCGDQVAYSRDLIGMTCDACEKGAAYTPVIDPQAVNGARPPWAKIGAFATISLVCLLSLTHLIIVRVRHLRRKEAEVRNPTLLAQCPFCSRKIEYSSSRAGTAWVCVQCKTAFLLPS
jgi:ribosomal protein L37AE/L43A